MIKTSFVKWINQIIEKIWLEKLFIYKSDIILDIFCQEKLRQRFLVNNSFNLSCNTRGLEIQSTCNTNYFL